MKKTDLCTARKFAHTVLMLGIFLFPLAWSSVEAAPAKVALIHLNPVLKDVNNNLTTIESLVKEAFLQGANIVVAPELATTGFSISRQEVLSNLGFTYPYPELNNIRDLAIQHHGYVFIAIAEVAEFQKVYNTVVVYGPTGLVTTQQKRGLSGWHDRGILPFNVITTPYGDIATIICSDTYLPDWIRITTLKGADLVLLPANWWGRVGQEEIWQTRARENGIWFLTANRWGSEVDERFNPPFTYYMNDAPSAAITPDGTLQLIHRAEDDPIPANKILYYTVNIPEYRIGTTLNPVYSVNFRKPQAYEEIANPYYRPDLGNHPAPNLPPPGITRVASMAYVPKKIDPLANIATIKQIWAETNREADVLILPGLGITSIPINSSNPNWYTATYWAELQNFTEKNGLLLLVTTVLEHITVPPYIRHSLLLVQPGKLPQLKGQIHDSLLSQGTGIEPVVLDLPNARTGILIGHDALFPEITTHLAKSGIDILLIASEVGTTESSHNVNAPNYFWEVDALHRLWKTQTDHVFHLAASDWTGNGVVIENTFGIIGRLETVDAISPVKILDFDSNFVRTKFLNAYYNFDLETLLGTNQLYQSKPASKSAVDMIQIH